MLDEKLTKSAVLRRPPKLPPQNEDVADTIAAWMPESIAVVKLRGYVSDMGGEVIDSEPGLVRVHLLMPVRTGEAAAPSGLLGWLGINTKAPAPHELALMELHFSDLDGHKAALVANAWADAYLQYAREALNPSVQAQQLVEVPLKDSLAELQKREDAVRQFQQKTGLGIAPSTDNVRIDVGAAAIPGASSVQTANIPASMRTGARGRELSAKTDQVNDLRAQRDQVRLVLAQLRALRGAGVPLDSIGADLEKLGIARATSAEVAIVALEAKEKAFGEAADRASGELRAIETALTDDLAQLERLERERDVARDAYVALTRKAEENKISLAADWPVLRQFARSPDPAAPEPRPWLIVLGPAAAAGLVVGVAGAFWLDRRRAARPTRAPRFDPLDSIA